MNKTEQLKLSEMNTEGPPCKESKPVFSGLACRLKILAILAFLLTTSANAQAPSIAGINPLSGPVGTSVTITGNNFDATSANNVVYFGGVRATVNAASVSELIVTVPSGATYGPVSVLTNNLITESDAPFVVTFDGNDAIDANTFLAVQTEAALSDFLVLGDLDGDGLLDVVTTLDASSTQIDVYRNTSSGTGSISLGSASPFTVHERIEETILSDLDGDGKLDIVTCSSGSGSTIHGKVSILRNTSSGPGNISFAAPVDYELGINAVLQSIASGDLDGDGKLDLAIANTSLDRVTVFKNQSSGPGVIDFLPQLDLATGSDPRSIKIADMDGDDVPDILVVDQTPNASVLRNTSTVGSFSFETKVDFALAATVNHVTAGDIDGDGLADIVASHVTTELSVFRNTSTVGSLSMAARLDYSTRSNQTALADLNGDGMVEMVSFSAANVNVYKNTSSAGAISHDAPQAYSTGGLSISSIAVGDMDNDGEADFLAPFTSFPAGGIGVFKNALSENDLLTFSFAEQTGAATVDAVNHTVDIEVAMGTDVTNLVATFTASSTAGDVAVGATSQTSATTANDFTNPVVYTVTAEDALTQNWTVTVTTGAACSPDNVAADESVCDSFDFDGATLTTSGTYNATLVNQAGCDSLVTLNLTILPSYDEVANIESCDSYDFDGATLTASGTYNGTFTSVAGCDSLVTMNLTILESTSSMENVEECESYTWNGTTYTASGTYQEMFTNNAGCDSTATLNLTILESHDVSETLDHCGDYQFGSQLLTTSGTYVETFESQAGCDSTVTLTFGYLTLPELEIEVDGVELEVESDDDDLTFQWIDCDTNTPIAGETDDEFTPPYTGNFAVEASNGICTTTSDCYLFDWILATKEQLSERARVYPTATTGSFTLDLNHRVNDVRIRILALNGNEVFAHQYESFVKSELQLRAEGGIYIVQVEAAGETLFTQRIFKK